MALIFGARTDRVINGFDGVTNDADTIVGDSESELIYGLGGNDVLKGGGGADRLDGGAWCRHRGLYRQRRRRRELVSPPVWGTGGSATW